MAKAVRIAPVWIATARIAIALLLVCAGASGLRADPIPQNVLDNSHKSCMENCMSSGPSAGKCTAYCNCTVDSIEEEFTGAEFMAMNAAAATSRPADPSSQEKLTAIIDTCRAKTLP